MTDADPLAAVVQALGAVRQAWLDSAAAGPAVDGLSGAALAALNAAVSAVSRSVDAVRAKVAADIARASRPELGCPRGG